jgi:hypothetical protein
MFVGDEVRLDMSFAVAREKLAQLGESGALLGTSEGAYAGLARVGPAGVSKLVRVQVRELSWTDRTAGLALRWEATGVGGGLFPVLDADLRLAPDGEQGTVLTLTGVYRPPLGPLGEALDRAILHRVAAVTIQGFVARVAAHLTGQPGPVPDGAVPDGAVPDGAVPNGAVPNGAGPSAPPLSPPEVNA